MKSPYGGGASQKRRGYGGARAMAEVVVQQETRRAAQNWFHLAKKEWPQKPNVRKKAFVSRRAKGIGSHNRGLLLGRRGKWGELNGGGELQGGLYVSESNFRSKTSKKLQGCGHSTKGKEFFYKVVLVIHHAKG